MGRSIAVALAMMCVVIAGRLADARRALPPPLPANHNEPPPDRFTALGHHWVEQEGAWSGTWVREVGTPNFRATWTMGTSREAARLRIRFEQNDVVVVERSQEVGKPAGSQYTGTCTYRGKLDRARNRVEGTYSCTWGGTNLPWSAAIDPKPQSGSQIAK